MRFKFFAVLLIVGLSGAAQAALLDRGGGMIYDDVLDITWLQNASQGGSMNWDDAVAWAGGLSFGGFDDWRLASMNVDVDDAIPVDCRTVDELACRDNELGYMYYHNLGGTSGDNLTGNQTPFTNIQLSHWAGEESPFNPDDAWGFNFGDGLRDLDFKGNDRGAWAVRDGDVAVDTDLDGALDDIDNCRDVSNVTQTDSDGDAIGNACDPDIAVPNDCQVNFADLLEMKESFFSTPADVNWNADADLTGSASGEPDSAVNFADLQRLKDLFSGHQGQARWGVTRHETFYLPL